MNKGARVNHIFGYIEFAAAVAVSVPTVMVLLKNPKLVTGTSLLSAVQPALDAFPGAFGPTIPQDKAVAICNAVADVVQTF